ncbi:MAG: DUF881 domain-containing protein, partial [Acidimicrobiales bacterium]
ADSDLRPPSPDDAGAYRIYDGDLQLVANALFAAGAEAVAVNGSRLVATSAIRAAGDTVVVNFRPQASPFRMVAIGADAARFDRSEVAQRFRRWKSLFGLGFDVSTEPDAVVPGFIGRVAIVHATPS